MLDEILFSLVIGLDDNVGPDTRRETDSSNTLTDQLDSREDEVKLLESLDIMEILMVFRILSNSDGLSLRSKTR